MNSRSSRRSFLQRAGTLALGAGGLERVARAASVAAGAGPDDVAGDRSAPAEALLARPAAPGATPVASAWPPPVGYATISWPEAQFTEATKTISILGFRGVQMLGWVRDSYSGDLEPLLKKQLAALKLEPAVLSCSRLRLDPARPDDQTASFAPTPSSFRSWAGSTFRSWTAGVPAASTRRSRSPHWAGA